MKRILTIAVLLVTISIQAEYKRYFDENKKGLDRRIQKGAYVLVCQTKEEFNLSGNSKNIVWDGETPRLKTSAERANDMKDGYEKQLAGALIQYLNSKYSTDEKIGLMDLDKYGNSNQKTVCKAIRDWIEIVQKVDFMARLNAIRSANSVEDLQAVSMDFSNNDASKPNYTYIEVLVME